MRRNPFGAAVLAAAGLLPLTAHAADHTFIVNTTEDAPDANPGDGVCATAQGKCTLRAAVMESNHQKIDGANLNTVDIVLPPAAVPYALTIPPSGAIDETRGALFIARDVRILGGGAAKTIVDGNAADSVFLVESVNGVFEEYGVGVVLSDLTIRNGSTPGNGGGIADLIGVTVTVTRCVIAGNTAASGGGIWTDAEVIVNRSTIRDNVANAGPGGGVSTLDLSAIGSTFSGNYASSVGGGVYTTGTTDIENCTITANIAGSNGGNVGGGGGAHHSGVYSASITASILYGNSDTKPTHPLATLEPNDCTGTFGGQNNIVGTASTCTLSATEEDPLLGPLQLNGGQVPTQALLAGSPAIDGGQATCVLGMSSYDGRGAYRPQGAACDVGAYEYAGNGDANGDGTRDVADVFFVINFLFAGGPAPMGLADVNGDGKTDIADVFFLINFLFAGGPAPL